jgi:hypothetical protein
MPGICVLRISFETLGPFSPGAMQFLSEATHVAFLQPGHQRDACFANVYRQLSVVQSRYLSRMLTAAAGLYTARTSSGWIRGAQQASVEVPHCTVLVRFACGGALVLASSPCVVMSASA